MNTIERIEARTGWNHGDDKPHHVVTADEWAEIKAVVARHRRLTDDVMGFTHEENYRVSKSNENSAFVDYRDLAALRGEAMLSVEALSKLEGE